MGADAFDAIMGALDAPMVIVTTAVEGERSGCLVGFHAQSSIDPPRTCVWISKANHTYEPMLRSTHLAVHYLTDADHELARLFGTTSGDDIDKFDHCDVETGDHGVPILTACPNRLVLRRTALLDEGGDHVGIVGEPIDARSAGSFVPLRLSDVSDLEAGHAPDEAETS